MWLFGREVYEELGYPWSKFQEYLEKDHVNAMQCLHVETGGQKLY